MRSFICLVATGFVLSSAVSLAGAVGNTPVTSRSTAARAVLTQYMVRADAGVMIDPFHYEPRNLIDLALRSLSALTTYQALRAAPAGVTVACELSGNFVARFAPAWSNRLTFEWQDCASNFFGDTLVLNGPGEVLLPGDSLAPARVLTLRLGDAQRDLVRHDAPPPGLPAGFPGPVDEAWNLRLTGLVPLARDNAQTFFPGRYTYEAAGFYRRTITLQMWVNGGWSVEYYPFTSTYSTDGALLTGEVKNPSGSWSSEFGIVWGRLSGRDDTPVYPGNSQAYSNSRFVSGTDLRMVSGYDGDLGLTYESIDGKVETDIAKWWGISGCRRAETYTYKTRSLMTSDPALFQSGYYQGGDLLINGSTVARFSLTGSQQGVDMTTHVQAAVPGKGNFSYDAVADFLTTMVPEAACAP